MSAASGDEAPTGGPKPPPRWVAAVLIALGATLVAGAVGWLPLKLSPGVPRWVGAAAGLVFLLGGTIAALPSRLPRSQTAVAAAIFTLFAAIAGWVAFAPGERRFSGGVAVGPFSLDGGGEWIGRAAFGLGALLCGLGAAYLWKRVLLPARTDAAAGR